MIKNAWLRSVSAWALVGGLTLAAGEAQAQAEVEEVVVTGSYIAGTPEDAALPVDVLNSQELQKQGSPTVVQLVKQLPAAAASIGESNRYLGSAAGTATVNLRGFGSARTLVLMNGRRMAVSPSAIAAEAIDINLIPLAAVGRIEVLKGGAAATYGSDAVGGVVNFITRRDLDGFEVNAEYSHIKGSEGDYNGSVAWGWQFDRGNMLLTAGYRRRSELRTTDRDWALQPNPINPFGGWSGAGNPGTYQTFAVGGATGVTALPGGVFGTTGPNQSITLTSFNDVGCTELGGFRNAAGACLFQYTRFDNLVNDEFHYQLYGEVNFDITDDLEFHAEAMWARHDVPDERVSPTQSTVSFPTPIAASGGSPGGGTSPFPAFGVNEQSRFYIPFANPGLQVLFASQCTGVVSAFCTNLANGVVTSQTGWRPQAYAGLRLFPDGADHQRRAVDSFRVSAGFKGKVFGEINWDAAVTYMDSKGIFETPDLVVNRTQLALRGLGGPGCNPVTGTPGAGPCQWFNPFSNAVRQDAVYGLTNPFYNAAAVPANTNTNALFAWMRDVGVADVEAELLVADLVFSGEIPFTLPGGAPGWALGAQWRYDARVTESNPIYDIDATRCVDDVDDHLPVCLSATGPFNFIANIRESSVDRNVHAVFGELKLPVTDTLTATFAVRHERYGGNIGETTNPKIDLRWQAFDWLALRASAGTTFRAPPQASVTPGFNRVLSQLTDPTTLTPLYRPVDTYNNPNLEPETADHYNLGFIVEAGGFSATVDYWKFKFEKELTNETGASIFTTMFPSATPSAWQCANPSLRSRFTFAVGTAFVGPDGTNCHPSNFLAVRSNLINGPSVDTSGVDFQASYEFPDLGEARLQVGVEGTYLLEYVRGPLITLDGIQIAAGLDRAGQVELLSAFYSYPTWKANGFANVAMGRHNLRATVRYVGPMSDRNHDSTPTVAGVQPAKVGGFVQLDLVYRVDLPWDTTLTAQVQNVFDENPSFAYSQYNYDYTLANPLGRVIGIGVRKRF